MSSSAAQEKPKFLQDWGWASVPTTLFIPFLYSPFYRFPTKFIKKKFPSSLTICFCSSLSCSRLLSKRWLFYFLPFQAFTNPWYLRVIFFGWIRRIWTSSLTIVLLTLTVVFFPKHSISIPINLHHSLIPIFLKRYSRKHKFECLPEFYFPAF